MPISAQSASAFRGDFLDFTQALTWQRDIPWSWLGGINPIGGAATFDAPASFKPCGAGMKESYVRLVFA
jgi:hypothetical protein